MEQAETTGKGVSLLLVKQVFGPKGRTKIPKSTGYEMIKNGEFPAPIRLTPRLTAFLESEVDAWLAERVARRTLRRSA